MFEKRFNTFLHNILRLRLRNAYKNEMKAIKSGNALLMSSVGKDAEDAHRRLWSKLDDSVNSDWVRFLSNVTGRVDHRYVPSPVYYGYVERCLNNCDTSRTGVEDKNLMSLFVPRESRAFCLIRYIRGCFFDDAFNPLSRQSAADVLARYMGDVVGKVAQGSSGGHSVELFKDNEGVKRNSKHELTVDWIAENTSSYVVQERLIQEPIASGFNMESVNTCRIMTFRRPWDGETRVCASMFRIGASADLVDNISSGGVSVGVLSDGTLASNGLTATFSKVDRHPKSGKSFGGTRLPGFDDMCKLACQVARKVPDYNVLGFDVIVRADGSPCIVEINSTSLCCIEVQQSGPMFGEDTEKVVEWCLRNARYDLFRHFRTWY